MASINSANSADGKPIIWWLLWNRIADRSAAACGASKPWRASSPGLRQWGWRWWWRSWLWTKSCSTPNRGYGHTDGEAKRGGLISIRMSCFFFHFLFHLLANSLFFMLPCVIYIRTDVWECTCESARVKLAHVWKIKKYLNKNCWKGQRQWTRVRINCQERIIAIATEAFLPPSSTCFIADAIKPIKKKIIYIKSLKSGSKPGLQRAYYTEDTLWEGERIIINTNTHSWSISEHPAQHMVHISTTSTHNQWKETLLRPQKPCFTLFYPVQGCTGLDPVTPEQAAGRGETQKIQ